MLISAFEIKHTRQRVKKKEKEREKKKKQEEGTGERTTLFGEELMRLLSRENATGIDFPRIFRILFYTLMSFFYLLFVVISEMYTFLNEHFLN